MTGYASVQLAMAPEAEGRAGSARRLGLEIRSVNSRFLDLSLRLSDELRAQEPALRALLTQQLKRGKVEVRAFVDTDESAALAEPTPRLLQRLGAVQDAVRSWLPDAAPLTVAEALRLCANAGAPAQDWSARRRQHGTAVARSQAQRAQFPARWIAPASIAALVGEYMNDTQARLRLHAVEQELEQGTWEQDATVEERHRRMDVTVREQAASLSDHQVKNAQAQTAVLNARESYIEVLRSTVRRYRKNIQELGQLAGVEVAADLPLLENDDAVLAQAGLKVHFAFDGKGSIGLNDGEASGGQQVIKSLILLVGLLKDEESGSGGFVFIDEPFAHLDVRNIQLVGHFLRSTRAQYVLTTPITHNLEVFEPAEITLVTSKKPRDARWAPPIAVAKRRGAPELRPMMAA